MRAVIIGAGIAGLSAALRLRKLGWQTLLVEKAPSRRGGGYGVTFGGIGYDGAENLGILSALRDKEFVTSELVYRKVDGRRRFAMNGATIAATMGEKSFGILRGDIESVLYEAVRDHAEFRFGTTVTAIDQDDDTVYATLSDGSIEAADLLIGADGLHSATRALVFGPEDGYRLDLDHKVAVFMLKNRPAELREGETGSISEGGRTFAMMSVGDGRTSAFFGYRTDVDGADTDEGPETVLPRLYGDMAWLVPQALAELKTADSVYFDSISQMVVDRWSHGRVVLLGDAAWCVTLFAGYGSSLAVGGADLLGSAIERHPGDIPAALAEWETQLRPETERKQKMGRRVKGVYAPRNKFVLELTQLPLRLASSAPVRRYMQRKLQVQGLRNPWVYSSISARNADFDASSMKDTSTAFFASEATPSTSRSSSRTATAYSLLRSVPNIGGSSLLIVTVTPAATISRIGCSSSDSTARVARLDVGHTSSGMSLSARCRSSFSS
ncbi:monooxygenase FAD-binding protein [Stackebrandtia nassauensis DSM 44728]|uniref:Monooxygenase FAD-binding protein n=1 Tax=Stackebrandtia nassauensis (strain DSM 44728 / CIP 108903 / NRRL B-16338 / NBRC 102104 / LLR-40K-21) TaxID=446470 RepID=D3Q7S6_STANL|nr:monooxygenase FAD-binding protein [Stackebrandtia nassauensis DSM 44728]